MRREHVSFVLNEAASAAMAAQMPDLLGELRVKVIGSVPYFPELAQAALAGRPLDGHVASEHVDPIVERLEAIAAAG